MEVRGGEGEKEKADRQAGQKKRDIVAALAMWDKNLRMIT
ncbi:hypothetical protein T03_1819 [Trichinella britovi]|uniref:Uncharacterized protein n=1 Tax=Trichinella britovi TaxID=45882 RepID=A0A0V0YUC5_TRIBR|nr:hypothetical protein T03_1819 [Trichinella britovi]